MQNSPAGAQPVHPTGQTPESHPSAAPASVGAVILAAGGSTRLGQPKQLLVYDGKTLIANAVQAARDGGCSPIFVVTGAHTAEILHSLTGSGAEVVHHPAWEQGIGSSIRAGVKTVLETHPALEALVLMVCDQPQVSGDLIGALIAARPLAGKPIVGCAYSDIVGVPALFSRAYFQDLAMLPDAAGARHILRRLPDDVAAIPFPAGAIDIDTPADHLAYICRT